MSETNIENQPEVQTLRSIDDINKEYTNTCAQLGQASYEQAILNVRIDSLLKRIDSLNVEGGEARKIKGEKNEQAAN